MAGLSSFPGRAVFQQRVQDSVQTAGIVIIPEITQESEATSIGSAGFPE